MSIDRTLDRAFVRTLDRTFDRTFDRTLDRTLARNTSTWAPVWSSTRPRFSRSARGYNLLELIVGVVIFTFAVLPLFWFSLTGGRATQNIGKRLMVAQIGQDILEYLLAKPYEECLNEARAYAGSNHWVVADNEFQRMCEETEPPEQRSLVHKQFVVTSRNLGYEVAVREDPTATNGRIALIEVKMSYLADDLDLSSPRLSLTIAGMKFDEDI